MDMQKLANIFLKLAEQLPEENAMQEDDLFGPKVSETTLVDPEAYASISPKNWRLVAVAESYNDDFEDLATEGYQIYVQDNEDDLRRIIRGVHLVRDEYEFEAAKESIFMVDLEREDYIEETIKVIKQVAKEIGNESLAPEIIARLK